MMYPGKVVRYWDDIQEKTVDYRVDVQALHNIFQERKVKCALDACCGAGSHLILLADLGYECIGIDKNADLLELAREKTKKQNLQIEFIENDIRDIRIKKKYDGVICMYTLGLLDIESIKRALRGIHNLLVGDGLFVFNVIGAESGEELALLTASSASMFLDLFVKKENLKIVRLNNLQTTDFEQIWTSVYLFEEFGRLTMEIHHEKLKFFKLDDIKEILEECGFKFISVNHRHVGPATNDMLICATAV